MVGVLTAQEQRVDGEDAFVALVGRESRFVFQVAYAILRNPHDAEDVVQDTFLRLYRGGTWRRVNDERAFLARTAWRLAVDRLPRRREAGADPEMADLGESPEHAAISNDWNAAIHRLMDALPEELRQPLTLSAIEALTSPEIAELMGIPEGTVRTRLMRARRILKEKVSALMEVRHER